MLLMLFACSNGSSSPTPTPTPPPAPSTAALTATSGENPVPFRSSGCSFSTPTGWYTAVRVSETGGVAFTPTTLTQRLNGSTVPFLDESYASRFGACTGAAFTPGVITANGAVCGTVGVCTASTFTTYQFSIAGTDANGRAMTFDSPVLQLGARPAGQSLATTLLVSRAPDPAP